MMEGYSPVMNLGGHLDVTLFRDISSGMLVVRRVVGAKQAKIYQELADIRSPHIPAVYRVSEMQSGEFEILEEYVGERTLEELLRENGCLAEGIAVAYAVQLCEALRVIHGKGLVHRDIKPGNIVITSEGKLYLIDFDIARLHRGERASDTELLGTQGYAAPEQFGFEQTDARSDIYATGVLLNMMLTGKSPQEGLPRGYLAKIVKRCTRIDPSGRYKSAKALGKALRPYLPKGEPHALWVLRQIPGFRSFTPWKMALAGCAYGLFWLSQLIGLREALRSGVSAVLDLVIGCIIYIFVLFFAADSFQMRSRIRWLEQSRGRWSYPTKCVLFAVAVIVIPCAIEVWARSMLAK